MLMYEDENMEIRENYFLPKKILLRDDRIYRNFTLFGKGVL